MLQIQWGQVCLSELYAVSLTLFIVLDLDHHLTYKNLFPQLLQFLDDGGRLLNCKKTISGQKLVQSKIQSCVESFLTYGCELTAEIHFAAANLYNLCLFLYFNGLGPSWSSFYLTGTTATEKIIGNCKVKLFRCSV